MLKNSDGKSNRQLAEKYCVGRTQVQNLMKRKRKILDLYEDDVNSSRKHQCVRANNDLNDLMWQWFQKLRSQMIPVSGPMMQDKTLTISIRFQSIYDINLCRCIQTTCKHTNINQIFFV